LKEIHAKDLYVPKKFYHSGALIITAQCDREYSMWKLTIALSCLPVATAYLYQLVSDWPDQFRRQQENKLKRGRDFGSYWRYLKHNSDTSLERCDRTVAFLGL
jgi:stalled ribosome alternative rescue factor ArfA